MVDTHEALDGARHGEHYFSRPTCSAATQVAPGCDDGRHALAAPRDIEWDDRLQAADKRIGAGDWAALMHR